MKTSQLRFGGKKIMDTKTFTNSFLVRLASILIISLCIGFFLSCSGGGSGQEFNITGGGFQSGNSNFRVEKNFKDEFPVENHTRINIEALNGEVVVTGGGDAKKVVVTANLSVGSDSWEDAEMHLGDLEILVTDNVNEILIETVQPEYPKGRNYLVEFDIIVPSGFEVIATQDNGSIDILEIENRVYVSNKNGNIFLYNIAGGVTVDVDSGSIESTVFLPIDEKIDLYTNNGSIELSIPASTSAELFAVVDGIGEIMVSDLDITNAVKTHRSLTGVIGDGAGLIELNVINGNMKITGFN